jgi:predicted acyl esterase
MPGGGLMASRHRRWSTVMAVVAAIAPGACASSAAGTSHGAAPAPRLDLSHAGTASFHAGGSVGQVYVIGAHAGQPLQLVSSGGTVIAHAPADAHGSLIFRNVAVANGYRVVADTGGTVVASGDLTVTSWTSPPPESFYTQQHVGNGYGYLRMRDGITLSMTVHLPGPPNKGPYPTVIEYSGYTPADPKSPQPTTRIMQGLGGYATVGINMRGTGCSGGAFDYFEQLQSTDGYDAIETIASQPWAAHHKVGLVGLSYPAITQLFVAQLRPPHLAAIAPLSVFDDTIRATLAPGGVLNTGFAVAWAKAREHDAEPAPGGGQSWATDRVNLGDKTCLTNQALHSQAPNIIQLIDTQRYWTDAIGLPLSPEHFVHTIDVPVYLAGDWQDEQTGGYFANLLGHFTGTSQAWFTAQNGSHADPLDPTVFARWVQFLSIFVAQKIPHQTTLTGIVSSVIDNTAFGTTAPLPPDPFAGVTTFIQAKNLFERFPRIRILFENGGGADPGAPAPRFEADYASWPVPATTATPWFFARNGSLVDAAPSAAGADSYLYDPSHQHDTTIAGGSQSATWAKLPNFQWNPPAAGTALSYETAALAHDVIVIGNSSVDLWLKSTATDTDLQVTITEVRPDGKEVYVQNGWLRASDRALTADATELRPTHPLTQAAVQLLPNRTYSLARVEMVPFAHVFRAGSRIRVIIDAPGGSRPAWSFDDLPAQGHEINTIGFGGAFASRIVLPVVSGVSVAPGLPACPGLRGQPCRQTAVITNSPGT